METIIVTKWRIVTSVSIGSGSARKGNKTIQYNGNSPKTNVFAILSKRKVKDKTSFWWKSSASQIS